MESIRAAGIDVVRLAAIRERVATETYLANCATLADLTVTWQDAHSKSKTVRDGTASLTRCTAVRDNSKMPADTVAVTGRLVVGELTSVLGVATNRTLVLNEPFASRWKRRAVTIPIMLAATSLGVLTLPITVVLAVAADVVRLRCRLPTVRVLLFLVQFGLNDSAEILLAPFYWVLAGFGTRLDSRPSVDRHQRLQTWSLTNLAGRADRLLGLRIKIDDDGRAALATGPAIVLCRHVNIVDASLPALLCQRLGYRTRSVIMAELLADPGFDLLYGRTGSVFIARDNGPEAQAMINGLVQGAGPDTVPVIFPEGKLFRPERLPRSLGRLCDRGPARAQMFAGLRNVLPPRPGGFLALVDALPAVDVVAWSPTPGSIRFRRSRSPRVRCRSPVTYGSRRGVPRPPTSPPIGRDGSLGSMASGCASTTGANEGREQRGPSHASDHVNGPTKSTNGSEQPWATSTDDNGTHASVAPPQDANRDLASRRSGSRRRPDRPGPATVAHLGTL